MTLLLWTALGCTDRGLSVGGPAIVVYVMYFENRSADPEFDVLGKGIADMLITDLATVDGLTVVERSRVQDLISELKLQQTDFFDPATVGKVGKAIGATHAVTGALTADEHSLQIDIRLVHTELGSVQMTDKVLGKKDQFFALERQLADKFTTSLGKALGPAPPSPGAQDVSVALDYARGLDLLDRGDWARAEQVLSEVLSRSPGFDLAKLRRAEAIERLAGARQRREALLGEEQRELLAHADERLAGDVTQQSTGRIDEWFGYRALRGQIYLAAANQMLRSGLGLKKTIPSDQQDAFREALSNYFQNALAMTAEMRAWQAAGRVVPGIWDLPDADQELVSRSNVSWSSIGRLPDEVAVTLAEQVCLGKLPDAFLGSDPTLVALDPQVATAILEELDRALADVKVFQPRFYERQAMRLIGPYGDCLLALGRKQEAMQRWQSGLDEFPKSTEYGRIEERIRKNL